MDVYKTAIGVEVWMSKCISLDKAGVVIVILIKHPRTTILFHSQGIQNIWER